MIRRPPRSTLFPYTTPSDLNYDAGDPTPSSCNFGATIDCTTGVLAVGQSFGVTVTFHVNPTDADGTLITNTATATSDTFDPNTANDSSSASTRVYNPVAVAALSVSGKEGASSTAAVAHVSGGSAPPTATINWGDGSRTELGTLALDSAGGYGVQGTHTYAEEGTYAIHVVATDGHTTASTDSAAIVSDAALLATGMSIQATEGLGFSGSVATFPDATPTAPLADLTTGITSGDRPTAPR